VNVMHFQGAVDETGLFGSLSTSVTTGMWGSVINAARITTVLITQLDNTSATQEFATSGAQWDGSALGVDTDPAVAGLVSTRTGFRGQASHGRVYLPFTDSGVTTGGLLVAGTETSMQAAWTAFITSTNSQGIPLQVVSPGTYTENEDGSFTQVKAPLARPVVSANVRTAVATQRRRQGRVQASSASTLLMLRELSAARAKPAKS
jgi:hypothetical protein